ncbi:hypothetical protein JP74_07930 [Devosia sp. 17-2-E-8]|nr:hypothetical protein JP74_07930 [Devosia sp. 17-2-E-8]
MSVRRRILALEIASLVFIVAMIALMASALRLTDHFAGRVDGVHKRFEALADLDGRANNYGEQVANAVLLGREKLDDLKTARLDMEKVFARLNQATRDEIATLGGLSEVQAELPEIEENRRMLELYHSIDLNATRALALQRDGRQVEGIQLFSRDVAFRLANELQPQIDRALQEERAEVAEQLDAIQDWQFRLWAAGVVLAVLALACLVALGYLLRRAIVRPLDEIAAAGRRLAEGDYAQRLETRDRGEFTEFAEAFNAVAASGEKRAAELVARTAELRSVSEQLKIIDTRRTQFLADVSHELRTPLTVLRGEADVALRSSADAAELRQSLERIQGQAKDLGRLLEDLMAFARADAENQPYVVTEGRIDEVVTLTAEEAELLAEPREARVKLDLGDDGSRVEADFRRIRQALMIGFDNAVKHSPPGGTIGVETALLGDSVAIRITDEGPGVSDEDQPRVFERFYRGRNENELENEGLGIGLAIAKDILHRHGGTISLGNRPEGGAVLEYILPLAGR